MAKKHTDEWQEPEAAPEQPRVADILSGPEQVGGYPRLLWAPDGTEITVCMTRRPMRRRWPRVTRKNPNGFIA